MPRKPTGQVIEPNGDRQRSWGLRFRAYGKRRFVTLGLPEEGWDRARAEAALRHALADVERGIWRPRSETASIEPEAEPTFHEFAERWLGQKEPELAEKTVTGYRWCLELHLLPVFGERLLSELAREDVDAYKAAKLREGRIGPAQVNKTLKVLSAILDLAGEYDLLDRNVAQGKNRRLKESKPERHRIEPEQLPTLLDAATDGLRALIATMAGCGLRVGEAVVLDWRDVGLLTRTVTVGKAKTDAGSYREVDVPDGPLAELERLATATGGQDRRPVFVNRAGRRQTIRNVEARLKTAIRHANVRLAELGIEPISERVTPHSLRRLYASLRFALRDDLVYVAEQMGHEDGLFSARVYAKAVKRRAKLSGNYLREFDRALHWAEMGRTRTLESGPTASSATVLRGAER